MSELMNLLERIGLSDKEARVYLACLRLGGSSIQDIAEEAGINRTTTYVIIRSLIEKGLASSFTKGKKKNFTAENPEQLKNLLTDSEQVIIEKRKQLSDIMPALNAIYLNSGKRPQVRFLEGKEALKATDIERYRHEKMAKPVCTMSPMDDFENNVSNNVYDPRFKMERIKAGIHLKLIAAHRKGPSAIRPSNPEELKEVRMIPRDKFPFSAGISITDDVIQITNYTEPVGAVIVNHKQMAEALRELFELAWESAERYDKEEKKKLGQGGHQNS